MEKKLANSSENKSGRLDSCGTGWKVLMVKHPQTGLYYAAGLKLGQ